MSTHTGPREWDAETYDRVSAPQLRWGLEVLERLPLRGDEIVLDAGCGPGRLTERLLQRLPHGRVVGVDASAAMVAKARERLGGQAEVRVVDLTELVLEEPVDAVFSNAVFHWIADHDRLFRALHEALRPGGRLVAQCGGKGNVAALGRTIRAVAVEQPFATHLAGFGGIWNFATADSTAERLRHAGFTDVDCWLEPKPVRPEEPREFLATIALGPHLARLPEALRDPFVEAVVERMASPVELDYVRLNISARRPS